ncbi:hypothetical protein DPMN_000907 [Dreissena polymorpha]|uniref:Uncharacterized protein n=1 Tax=Dreissena polymorpha TaxID=45954 RepID=A0A9D4RPW8_DREPO|nr:hypothetical protein DPMN_000907 [Dreissena polymorpha]
MATGSRSKHAAHANARVAANGSNYLEAFNQGTCDEGIADTIVNITCRKVDCPREKYEAISEERAMFCEAESLQDEFDLSEDIQKWKGIQIYY